MTRPDTISATELAALLEADAAPSILDVLPADDWRRCRLPRASNACVFAVGFVADVEALAPDRATPLVVYGAGEPAHDAIMAAEKLDRAGYLDVRVLAGGLARWQAEGRPVAGEAGVPDPA